MLVKEVLQLLVSDVDTQLLERVDRKVLKPEYILDGGKSHVTRWRYCSEKVT